jgi:hypothetical protein
VKCRPMGFRISMSISCHTTFALGSHWRRRKVAFYVIALLAPLSSSVGAAEEKFILASESITAKFIIEAGTDPAVSRASDDLRSDIERVSGFLPQRQETLGSASALVIAGIVGQSKLLDRLVADGKIDLTQLSGAWESFIISVVSKPFPGVEQALVIAGSDRRGAIYGLYEISGMIGVSPWVWWADVAPRKQPILEMAAGTRRFGPPSVKYRGIFINDEDWGLQPWAAKTFEPETGDLGPKTYAKIFELLLRLKANVVWPGMHPTTRAFNYYPRNKEVADAYGIVMGSSHAEPMLRNNVDEWTAPKKDYNYVTNREGVLRYWEQRVVENSRYENIYTLGMRGIHDSNMQGPTTDAERIRVLETVFADQRALITRHVQPEIEQVPQMFCAYKEVLGLYRLGLRVPDDVTIVWPDDNFGYVRNFAAPVERQRSGGFGVYYHLSYLGRPLSYLWLCTTPPALIWEEMHKAYEHGADRMWIANVGDLKPAEIATEFFLQMAWDINRWRPDNLSDFLPSWATREFGSEHAQELAALLADYYLLNFQRKPEHLQWWLPRQPRRPSEFTDTEVATRLATFSRLRLRTHMLREKIPAALRDAFYQLVYYPIIGSSLANDRFFEGEKGNAAAALAADSQLKAETRFFNEELAGGKWRGIIALEPADSDWASMRIAPWSPPTTPRTPVPSPAADTFIALPAADFVNRTAGNGAAWTVMPGLGRTGKAVTTLPTNVAPLAPAAATSAPRLDYTLTFPAAGEFQLHLHLLPTHAISGSALRLAIALDEAAPQIVSLEIGDGGPDWSRGVLDAVRIATTKLSVPKPGHHTLRVYAIDPGIVLDKLVVDLGGLTPTYLGPVSPER